MPPPPIAHPAPHRAWRQQTWQAAGLIARVAFALAVGYFGFLLRLRGAEILPLDNDEGGYYLSSRVYADMMRERNWNGIIDGRFGYEHPPLAKLVYGLAIVVWPTPPEIWQHPDIGPPQRLLADGPFKTSRVVASSLGALQVAILTFAHPIAGALLCVSTWHCKYTGQVMMEPLACVFSTLCALFYARAIRGPTPVRGAPRWLVPSAIALGLTAACKYPYAVVGLAILADWLPRRWAAIKAVRREDDTPRRAWLRTTWHRLRAPFLWGVGSLLTFAAFNPRMYRDPFGRLWESFVYHYHYSRSAHVMQADEPMYAPALWLSGFSGEPMSWHPGIFLIQIDPVIGVLSVVGVVRLWRERRVFGIWLVGTLAFLTVWNTKWPQYLLMVLVPQMMAAVAGGHVVLGLTWRATRWQLGLAPPHQSTRSSTSTGSA